MSDHEVRSHGPVVIIVPSDFNPTATSPEGVIDTPIFTISVQVFTGQGLRNGLLQDAQTLPQSANPMPDHFRTLLQ